MDALKDLKWPAAFAIFSTLATIVALVYLGQSLTAVGVFIAGLLGYQAHKTATQGKEVSEVKSLANGNNEALRTQISETRDQMLEMSKDHAKIVAQLAAMLPAGTQLPQQLSEPSQDRAGNV